MFEENLRLIILRKWIDRDLWDSCAFGERKNDVRRWDLGAVRKSRLKFEDGSKT